MPKTKVLPHSVAARMLKRDDYLQQEASLDPLERLKSPKYAKVLDGVLITYDGAGGGDRLRHYIDLLNSKDSVGTRYSVLSLFDLLGSQQPRITHPRAIKRVTITVPGDISYLLIRETISIACDHLLKDPYMQIRIHALDTKAFIGDPNSEQLFLDILNDHADWLYSGVARESVLRAEEATQELLKIQFNRQCKEHAIAGLATIGGEGNTEILVSIIRENDKRLAKHAKSELAQHANKEILWMFLSETNFECMSKYETELIKDAAQNVARGTYHFDVNHIIEGFGIEANIVKHYSGRPRPKELAFLPEAKIAILMAASALEKMPHLFKSGKIWALANEKTELELAKYYGLAK